MINDITLQLWKRIRDGEASEGNPTHQMSAPILYRVSMGYITRPGDTDDEPQVHLELQYDDNPKAFKDSMPEEVRLDIPLSAWAGLVASIREQKRNPECWQEP